MPKKQKVSPEEKVKIIQEYLKGVIRYNKFRKLKSR